MTTFGVLGVGSIAAAIVTGLCDGVAEPPAVVLSPRNARRAADLAARLPSVRVAGNNQAVVDDSEVVIVCLLPDHAVEVLSGLTFRADQAVVSAVAGLEIAHLRELVAPATDVARSIPVPAVASRGSTTPVFPGTPTVVDLFGRVGGSLPIADELAFDSVSAASATVAAYFHYLDAIASWLAGHGLSAAEANRYVADQFAALSEDLSSPSTDFERLADAHTTTGGLNEQFARHLDNAGLFAAVRTGLDEVLERISPGS